MSLALDLLKDIEEKIKYNSFSIDTVVKMRKQFLAYSSCSKSHALVHTIKQICSYH
jgi:hypothetical protein